MSIAGYRKRMSIVLAALAGLLQAACLGSNPPTWEAADLKAPDGILGRYAAVETIGAEVKDIQIDVFLEDDTYVAARYENVDGTWTKDSEDVFRLVQMKDKRYLAIDYADDNVFYSFLYSDQPAPGQFTLRQMEMIPSFREDAVYLASIKKQYDLDVDIDKDINTVVLIGAIDVPKLRALFTDPQFMKGVRETNSWVLKTRLPNP